MKHLHQFRIVLFSVLLTLLLSSSSRAEVKVGGFTDISFAATDDKTASTSSGFKEGQFVLHLSSALSDQLSFFSEISWTPHADEFGTEIERAIFTYRFSDAFKPSAGRYHTPVSWWNTAFHHGIWLQTSVDRPLGVKFGSKFLPVHFVGTMVDGRVFPGGFSLSYAGGVGNGRGNKVGRAGDAGDANNHRALLARVALRHDAFYDLQIGGSAYVDRFPIPNQPQVNEQIFSAFVVLTKETPEIIAEVFYVLHQDEFTNEDTVNTSYYVQAAYRLPWFQEVFKPYARIEEINIDGEDRAFSTPGSVVNDLHRFVAGLRYDFATIAALKFEGRRFSEDGGDYINEIYTSLNLAF